MSAEQQSVAALSDWSGVEDVFGPLRTEQQELEHLLCDAFDKLEHVRTELKRHEARLKHEREELARECEALRTAVMDGEQESVDMVATCTALRMELVSAQSELDRVKREASEAEQWATQQTQELLDEREQLLHDFEAASRREVALESKAAELETVHNLLAEAEAELKETRSRLSSADSAEDKEKCELQQHCSTLEAELEKIRGRAAQLTDTLAQTKRQMSEESAQWSEELKQMRRVLERQAEAMATQAAAPAVHPGPELVAVGQDAQPVATRNPGDAVVGSVMAQFERLRSERAGRLKRRQKGT